MAKKKRVFTRLLVVVGLVAAVFVAIGAFRAGPAPQIRIEPELPAIGPGTPVLITAEEPKRGLSVVRVELLQGERVELLEERTYVPRPPWQFWGPRTTRDELLLEVGRETVESLREGEATIRVSAGRAPSWLRLPQPAVQTHKMEVKLRPPQRQVTSLHTYVAQGGAEAVVYRVSADAVRDGVQAGDWWFPGYPLPGGSENERFALFSAPYDLDDHGQIRLVAGDVVLNTVELPFVDRFFAKPPKTDTIRLSESFMARVVPAILSQTPELQDQGDLLQNYLAINRDLRRINNQMLIDLAAYSAPEFLWSREFLPMRNAQVMSDFADRRTYTFEGRDVDQQDHLGFDLASTRRAEIQAANDGVVLLAGWFGIYGNAVLIDHGYGLMSLYGHLSEVSVAEGEAVERGQVVGRSGQTGLAGGDHLHFTTLLQGLPVNPREWWDAHWIQDRLKLKLGPALPFEE